MPSQFKFLIQSFFIFFLLIGVQSAYANTGKAFSIKGKVTVNGEPLTLASEIKEGDLIETEEGSSVKIIMKDGSVLDIDASTLFEISEYAYNEAAPEKNKGAFDLLSGAFRYVSGLIAKKDPSKIALTAGTATIGIRGSFASVRTGRAGSQSGRLRVSERREFMRTFIAKDKALKAELVAGTITSREYFRSRRQAKRDARKEAGLTSETVAVEMAIGSAELTITNADGSTSTLSITKGTTGTMNVSTGATSTTPTSNAVAVAAEAMAANPDNAAAALANMTAAEKALVISVLINNASSMTPPATTANIVKAVGNAVKADKNLAATAAYVSSALSPGNKEAFKTAITTAAPEQVDAISDATEAGTKLGNAPVSKSVFNLRTNPDGTISAEDEDGNTLTIDANNASGTPLTTEEIQETLEALVSGS